MEADVSDVAVVLQMMPLYVDVFTVFCRHGVFSDQLSSGVVYRNWRWLEVDGRLDGLKYTLQPEYFFQGVASCKFTRIRMCTARWWTVFIGYPGDRGSECGVDVTRLGAPVRCGVKVSVCEGVEDQGR